MNNGEYEIDNCIFPICVGNSNGNGFVIGDLFFTASYVAKESASYTIYIENEAIQLDTGK